MFEHATLEFLDLNLIHCSENARFREVANQHRDHESSLSRA